jgi:uncharacterized membrane protein
MTESSLSLWFVYMILCIIFFIAGIFVTIFNKAERKSGIKMMVFSIIGFIIGFGGCLTYLHFNPFRI